MSDRRKRIERERQEVDRTLSQLIYKVLENERQVKKSAKVQEEQEKQKILDQIEQDRRLAQHLQGQYDLEEQREANEEDRREATRAQPRRILPIRLIRPIQPLLPLRPTRDLRQTAIGSGEMQESGWTRGSVGKVAIKKRSCGVCYEEENEQQIKSPQCCKGSQDICESCTRRVDGRCPFCRGRMFFQHSAKK
jgi:hypothetical protein